MVYQRSVLDKAPISAMTHLLACDDITKQNLAPFLAIPACLTGPVGLTDYIEVQASY